MDRLRSFVRAIPAREVAAVPFDDLADIAEWALGKAEELLFGRSARRVCPQGSLNFGARWRRLCYV